MEPKDEAEPTPDTRRQPHRVEVLNRRMGAITLRVLEGPLPSDRVQRWHKGRVLGGRGLGADLCLDDPALSTAHFELRLERNQIWLKDLGSTNGTWIGENLVGEVGLAPGAIFSAGSCVIQLLGPELVDVPISSSDCFGRLYGRSHAMREAFALLERVASSDIDVILQGETGTGKELAARAIHERSARRDGPFVVLDCSTLNSTLADDTLFGHTKGAFTDAKETRLGSFEQADGGTIFIDEIGELPLDLQPKLLRVLDRREIVRVGEVQPRSFEARFIVATHRDLQRMVTEGTFRQDLYYRLSNVLIELPPLREREGDVTLLANRFAEEFGASGWTLSEGVHKRLRGYPWPGNVRELRRIVRAAVSMNDGGSLVPERLILGSTVSAPSFAELTTLTFEEAYAIFERYYLTVLLRASEGNLTEAERRSKITRKSIRERLRKHGLRT
jgi:transcriptional regulator with GAF, ATPase, and Fis domain